MLKKMKILDSQNLVLNTERIGYEKNMFLLRKEAEKEKEGLKKTIIEYENNIRLLIRKIKKMKKKEAFLENQRSLYSKEFIELDECFKSVKEELSINH